MKFLIRCLLFGISATLLAGSAFADDGAEKVEPEAATAGSSEGASTIIDPDCKKASENILDALVKGDYEKAESDFNADMKKKLPPGKLQEAWESLFIRFGTPKLRGDAQGKHGDGLSVIYTPLKFEKGNLVSQVACDAEGKIAGFYVVPEMPPKPAENQKPIQY